jgi:MFS family permease
MLAAALTQAVYFGIAGMMPLLARKRFEADDWQTVLVTAIMPTLMVLSVFWGDFLRRVRLRRYLSVHWAIAALPLAAAGFAESFWTLLFWYGIACVGSAGWSPVAGELLKGFYGDAKRGRAFALVNTAMLLSWTCITLGIGYALDVNENAYRIYLPLAAGLYGLGILLLRSLVLTTNLQAKRNLELKESFQLRRFIEPVLHMNEILRTDRLFASYEMAFMTYGIGFMICSALLPVMATDKFDMNYTDFAQSTQAISPLCMLLMTYPMGRVMDRLGPAKTSCLSFAWLAAYPVALLIATTVFGVGVATAIYGAAMAGVHIGWMLGPVTFARTPERVGQYVAIHTTLVGLRGVFAQGLGMLIYVLTGHFGWPFGLASLAFAFASWQMWRLSERMKTELPTPGL